MVFQLDFSCLKSSTEIKCLKTVVKQYTVFSLIEAPGAKAGVKGASIFSPNALNTKINMIKRKQNVTQTGPISYSNTQDLLQWKLLHVKPFKGS